MKKTHMAVFSFLLLFMLAVTQSQVWAASSGADASITVSQSFTKDNQKNAASTVGYLLEPEEADNPMPAGTSADGRYYFSLTGMSETAIPIHFTRTGIYTYKVSRAPDSADKGTGDHELYTVSVIVKNAGDGLVAQTQLPVNSKGEKEDQIRYVDPIAIDDAKRGDDTKGDDDNDGDGDDADDDDSDGDDDDSDDADDSDDDANGSGGNGGGTKASKTSTTKTTTSSGRAKTGDNSALEMWVLTAALALGILFVLVIKKSREEEEYR